MRTTKIHTAKRREKNLPAVVRKKSGDWVSHLPTAQTPLLTTVLARPIIADSR
jgi:hypothetical protein